MSPKLDGSWGKLYCVFVFELLLGPPGPVLGGIGDFGGISPPVAGVRPSEPSAAEAVPPGTPNLKALSLKVLLNSELIEKLMLGASAFAAVWAT